MIVSHRFRFILLLPWKAASQTLRARLGAYDESPARGLFYFNPHLNRVAHQHLTLPDFASLPEGRLGYPLAAFVRNPYDRAYSGFHQLLRFLPEQSRIPYPEGWLKPLLEKQLSEILALFKRAEFDFDNWVELLSDDLVYNVGRNSCLPLYPAHYWTHWDGERRAAFIGKVERFEEDFQRLTSRYGLEARQRINRNIVDLTGASDGNPHGYRYVHRMSGRSIAKINSLFRRDFELLSYRMVE